MKKKKNQEEIKASVHPITIADLAEERKQEVKCQNPIKLGWTIYAVAAILYILNGLTANLVVDLIPEKAPIVSTLNNYKQTEEYNDYIAETQKQATNKLTNGEITVEEYNFIIETLSSDEKFEEFLRLIDGDEFVKQTITDYDEYKNKTYIMKEQNDYSPHPASIIVFLVRTQEHQTEISTRIHKCSSQEIFLNIIDSQTNIASPFLYKKINCYKNISQKLKGYIVTYNYDCDEEQLIRTVLLNE